MSVCFIIREGVHTIADGEVTELLPDFERDEESRLEEMAIGKKSLRPDVNETPSAASESVQDTN